MSQNSFKKLAFVRRGAFDTKRREEDCDLYRKDDDWIRNQDSGDFRAPIDIGPGERRRRQRSRISMRTSPQIGRTEGVPPRPHVSDQAEVVGMRIVHRSQGSSFIVIRFGQPKVRLPNQIESLFYRVELSHLCMPRIDGRPVARRTQQAIHLLPSCLT